MTKKVTFVFLTATAQIIQFLPLLLVYGFLAVIFFFTRGPKNIKHKTSKVRTDQRESGCLDLL
jgi:hypothetical protein